MILKKLSIVIASSLCACAYGTGAKPPRDVKVYYSQPSKSWCVDDWCKEPNGDSKTGLIRLQQKEVIPYEKTNGYLCTTSEDFQRIIETCPR